MGHAHTFRSFIPHLLKLDLRIFRRVRCALAWRTETVNPLYAKGQPVLALLQHRRLPDPGGKFGLWVTSYDYLHWPWSAVVWYIWLPANCALALAPAYQLETIFQAVTEGRRNPEIQSST
jgi:hypothetical protein